MRTAKQQPTFLIGLPSTDGSGRTVNRIAIAMDRGAILINAGAPDTGPAVRVTMGSAARVDSRGGRFTIGRRKNEWQIHAEEGIVLFSNDDTATSIEAGTTLSAELCNESGRTTLEVVSLAPDTPPEYEFHTCREYFRTLQPIADDDRVTMWDLYNRPDHSGMGIRSLPLVKSAFEWARSFDPSQPLTAGVEFDLGAEAAKEIMDLSDVLSFNAYDGAEDVESRLLLTEIPARPVVCTGWLRRRRGNTFKDVLPIFAEHDVGWYHWGLVAGRTQMYLPQEQVSGEHEGDAWDQDVLNADGDPYDEEEIKLIRAFGFDTLRRSGR